MLYYFSEMTIYTHPIILLFLLFIEKVVTNKLS